MTTTRLLSEHDRSVIDRWLERGGYLLAHTPGNPDCPAGGHLTHDEDGEGLSKAERREGDEHGGIVGGVSKTAIAYARERGWEPVTHCECGKATGEYCAWSGPIAETVEVEWMPAYLRASHIAAGGKGAYPYNGALRIRVEKSCAEELLRDDPEWTRRAGEVW